MLEVVVMVDPGGGGSSRPVHTFSPDCNTFIIQRKERVQEKRKITTFALISDQNYGFTSTIYKPSVSALYAYMRICIV